MTPATKLQYPTCRQLLADGRYCPCPALSDKSFCRHHTDERQRQRNLVKARQLKEYTQDRRIAAGQNVRPEEELNAAIFDSLAFPTLDTTAAICVAASNVARLLGGGYITPRAAAVMAKLIRIAEINLRQGPPIFRPYLPTPPVLAQVPMAQTAGKGTDSSVPKSRVEDAHRSAEGLSTSATAPAGEPVPPPSRNEKPETNNALLLHGVSTNNEERPTNNALLLHSDPVPTFAGSGLSGNGKPETGNPLDSVPPLGDEDGFVLPEESNLKRLHDQHKQEVGPDEANEFRAALGNMPALIDELDPKYAHLPPMERGRAAYRDLRQLIAPGEAGKVNARSLGQMKASG